MFKIKSSKQKPTRFSTLKVCFFTKLHNHKLIFVAGMNDFDSISSDGGGGGDGSVRPGQALRRPFAPPPSSRGPQRTPAPPAPPASRPPPPVRALFSRPPPPQMAPQPPPGWLSPPPTVPPSPERKRSVRLSYSSDRLKVKSGVGCKTFTGSQYVINVKVDRLITKTVISM